MSASFRQAQTARRNGHNRLGIALLPTDVISNHHIRGQSSLELLKLNGVGVGVVDQQAINTKASEPLWRIDDEIMRQQSSIAGINIVGNHRDHAACRLDNAIGKDPANADSVTALGGENSRASGVTSALQAQHTRIELRTCLGIFGIHPANQGMDTGFAISKITSPSASKK